MYSKHKTQLSPLSPVAIKLGQHEVHAPEHVDWGIVTCDICSERFAIAAHRIHGSRISEEAAVKQFEEILAQDHKRKEPHKDGYELAD